MTEPNAANDREFRLGELRLVVQHRTQRGADGGPTLRVRDADGREWLRFDCFRFAPHYHLANAAEAIPYGPVRDPVTFAIDALHGDFAAYLERADYPGTVDWSADALDAALSDVESALRNPPARFDELDPALLQTRLSEKWETYPDDIQPAWVAEMDFPLAEPIRVVLERAVDRWDVGYPIAPNQTGLREAFRDRMQKLWGWEIDPHRVEILSEVVQGMYLALQAYSEPGDGVVVQPPIYPPFFDTVRETGRTLVEHPFEPPSQDGAPGYAMDVERLRAGVDERTQVLLFCNPHNPSGRVFRREELEAVADLAREQDWVVVSDEIHQDLVFTGHQHIPFATLSEDAAQRTVTLTSATKAFNIPGLRTAVAHFGTPELHRRFNAVIPRHTRGGIGLLGLYATQAAWRHADPWLAEVRAYLEANRDFVAQVLALELPEIVCQPAEATYLQWLDCRALDLEPSPARFLYEH